MVCNEIVHFKNSWLPFHFELNLFCMSVHDIYFRKLELRPTSQFKLIVTFILEWIVSVYKPIGQYSTAYDSDIEEYVPTFNIIVDSKAVILSARSSAVEDCQALDVNSRKILTNKSCYSVYQCAANLSVGNESADAPAKMGDEPTSQTPRVILSNCA